MSYTKHQWINVPDPLNPPAGAIEISAETLNEMEEGIYNAVEKEDGKGLSENDYTDEEKEKVENSVQKNSVTWGDLMPL